MGLNMKKFLAGVIGAAAFAGNALAADLPARVPLKATPNEVVAYNWSGFYTASSLGGGWQNIDGVTIGGLADNSRTSRGWSGSHVGLQGQWGNWVLGVEGSYASPLDGKFSTSAGGSADCGLGAAFTCNSRIRSIWAGGGKVGYAVGDWMVYGAGGYANARIEDTITTVGGIGVTSGKASHGGWYAGGGVDWFVTRIWYSDLILGVEYRHYEFGNEAYAGGIVPGFNRTLNADVDTVMAKATFKWVGAGPLTPFIK